MKKYLVPCVALLGIALLTPRADAANLLIKSRAEPPVGTTLPTGGTALGTCSLPVYATSVSANLLWGVDFALSFDTTKVAAVDANNAFVPFVSSASDVVVTGGTFVGGGTQPNLYVGYVKGAAGYDPLKALGLLKLKNVGTVALNTFTVFDLNVPTTYMVKNDGTGNDVSRVGATGVNSTATAGDPVNAEAITVMGFTSATPTPLHVPLHKIANGIPGDLTGDRFVNVADLAAVKGLINGTGTKTPFKLITADVAPGNGYTAAAPGGLNGFGYGDGLINVADLAAVKGKINGTGANFPAAE